MIKFQLRWAGSLPPDFAAYYLFNLTFWSMYWSILTSSNKLHWRIDGTSRNNWPAVQLPRKDILRHHLDSLTNLVLTLVVARLKIDFLRNLVDGFGDWLHWLYWRQFFLDGGERSHCFGLFYNISDNLLLLICWLDIFIFFNFIRLLNLCSDLWLFFLCYFLINRFFDLDVCQKFLLFRVCWWFCCLFYRFFIFAHDLQIDRFWYWLIKYLLYFLWSLWNVCYSFDWLRYNCRLCSETLKWFNMSFIFYGNLMNLLCFWFFLSHLLLRLTQFFRNLLYLLNRFLLFNFQLRFDFFKIEGVHHYSRLWLLFGFVVLLFLIF